MSKLVIVAIPREDDPVWKVSSEKVPHMTLLFLGEADNPNRGKIAEFLEHAISTMTITQFGLDVDRRGELGEDKADVLFFQDNWELPRVRDFRSMLLKDNNIKTAYDSVEQFPVWTPHMTLGYPESPAKPTSERIYWVQFDRIALWEGDSQGVEFLLKRDYYPMEALAMADESAAGRVFLAHYGVKGMKWGVRRARPATDVSIETRTRTGLRGVTKIKAQGGMAQPASPDAIKAAIQKQKLRKSGAAALSNKELQELANRMQLEVNVKRLSAETASGGQKFVRSLVKDNAARTARAETTSFVDRVVQEAKTKKQ